MRLRCLEGLRGVWNPKLVEGVTGLPHLATTCGTVARGMSTLRATTYAVYAFHGWLSVTSLLVLCVGANFWSSTFANSIS